MLLKKILHLFPELKREIWMICFGRLFSQIGHGLLIFSATIFWVNLIELSPTQIGIGLGLTSLAGIFGRLLGGTLIDSSTSDCRLILLISTMISAIADFLLASNQNFSVFLIGSFLMGLGIGMSWLAISAVITTIVTNEQYNEAFAVTRLSERIGVNGGIFLGGFAIAKMGANNIETYQKLYLLDGLTFVIFFFFCLIYFYLPSNNNFDKHPLPKKKSKPFQSWEIALKDPQLMLFTLAAILVTANISQLRITLPLYFGAILTSGDSTQIFSSTIANLFTYYTFLIIISQLPLSHFLNRWNRLSALMFSLLLYLGGFIIFWLAGLTPSFSLTATIVGLALLAFAVAAYDPLSLAFITDIAPPSLRGIYLSINSLSWTIGFAIGPSLGGWFLEHPQINGFFNFWLLAATSIVCAFLILLYLSQKSYESQEAVLTSSPS